MPASISYLREVCSAQPHRSMQAQQMAEACCASEGAWPMRALIQRVACAEVRVGDTTVGTIARGLLVLLGVREGDTIQEGEYLASKIGTLRIFEDGQGKMNLDGQEG